MAAHVRRLPSFAVGLISLLVLLAACSQKVTAPPEPPYAVRRGDEAFRYADYNAAITEYRNYLDQTDQDEYTPRVFYKIALSQYRTACYQDALGTLDELQQRYPKGRWVQVEGLRGDAARELGKPTEALKAWDEGWSLGSDNDRRKLRQRIVSLGRGLNNVDLARAQREVSNTAVRDILEQQIAARQPSINEAIPPLDSALSEESIETTTAKAAPSPVVAKGNTRGALTPREAVQAARRPILPGPAPAEPAAAAAAPAVTTAPVVPLPAPATEAGDHKAPAAAPAIAEVAPIAEVPPVAVAPPLPAAEAKAPGEPQVGCLLPLSGPYQPFGERSLRGLRMVFGERSDHLVVLDTANDAATAMNMFNQLSRNPNIVAVIGPLRSEDAEAAAPLARQAQLPLLLLSQRDGLGGGSVLQVGMTRSGLVGALLQYAMNKVRMRRFGVLYPADDFGKEYLATFRSEVERRGGTVVGADAYPPGTHTLSAATLKQWRKEQHLQAIFVPDNVTTAQTFALFLQREMPDITLLGVHGWESIASEANGGANGILFSDGFYSGSMRPGTKEFVERFQEAHGAVPGALEAQAYDAGRLVQEALQAGARSRVEVLRTLQGRGPIDGATGQLVVTPAGLERQLFLLQVYDGKIEELHSAG